MKKTQQIILCLVFGCIGLTNISAQNQINLSQHMLYQPFMNPSALGSYNGLSAGFIHRDQWVGFDGAPKTNILSINTPLAKTNISIGLGFQQEKIGIANSSSAYGNVAYRARIDKESYLSIGLSLGVNMFNLNYSELINSTNDVQLGNGVGTQYVPSPLAKIGVFYFKKQFYLTAYIPSLITPEVSFTDKIMNVKNSLVLEELHYYMQTGYGFKVSSDLEMNVSTLLKKSSTFQYDLNAQFVFNDFFGIGASYRSSKTIAVLLNLKLADKLKIGYAYDYSLTEIANVSRGTHEVMLILNVSKNILNADIQIPRF